MQFKSAAELEREIEESLIRWGINPGDIELELTESVLMEATQRHSNTLQNLRQLGIKIAIDDFGTGYSSLKYLTQYPVNRLKLAQEFVFRVTVDYRNAAVVGPPSGLPTSSGSRSSPREWRPRRRVRFLLGGRLRAGAGLFFQPAGEGGTGDRVAARGPHRAGGDGARGSRLRRPETAISEIGVAQRVEAAAVPLGRARALAARSWHVRGGAGGVRSS